MFLSDDMVCLTHKIPDRFGAGPVAVADPVTRRRK
jgi:hypothetical protein